MQEYTSRQQQIRRSAQQIYDVVSRFDNLTPALADRVEEWQADEDTCSFKAKGFTVKLRIAEKEAPKTIKIVGGDGGVPMDFAFWLQLKEVAPYDTRMRLVLHIDLNMMMRMMIGSKIQGAIDQIAEASRGSERTPPAGRARKAGGPAPEVRRPSRTDEPRFSQEKPSAIPPQAKRSPQDDVAPPIPQQSKEQDEEGRHRRCEGSHGRTSLAFRKKSRPPYRHRRNGVCRTTDTARQTSRSASADAADPFFRRRDFEIPPKYVIFVRTINHQYSAHGTPRFHQLRK